MIADLIDLANYVSDSHKPARVNKDNGMEILIVTM